MSVEFDRNSLSNDVWATSVHKHITSTSATNIPIEEILPPFEVKLSLTIVFTALYALLFLFIWIQLLLILVYRHKRFSYQSVFLYLCLLWAALRTTLFSFYFNDSDKANGLTLGCKWLLYSFPIALQFFTLSLLALYFSQVIYIDWLCPFYNVYIPQTSGILVIITIMMMVVWMITILCTFRIFRVRY